MLKVHAVKAFNDNYIWLIQSENGNHVLIVDPGDAEPVIAYLQANRLTPAAILITHHHADHIGGIASLLKLYDIPVYGPPNKQIDLLSDPLHAQTNVSFHSNFPTFDVLETPGHTTDHLSFLTGKQLFCGDTLFTGGCGRLLGGTISQLFHSLQQIKQLPQETLIYCAHEYTQANLAFATAIDPNNNALIARVADVKALRDRGLATVPSQLHDELSTNPFLRVSSREIQMAAEQYSGRHLKSDLDVFETIRAWKDKF